MKAPFPIKVIVLATLVSGLLFGAWWAAVVEAPGMGPVEAGIRFGFAVGCCVALYFVWSWGYDKINEMEEKARERRDR